MAIEKPFCKKDFNLRSKHYPKETHFAKSPIHPPLQPITPTQRLTQEQTKTMASLFDASTFETFDIPVSTTPPISLHGHRSTPAHAGSKPPLVLLHGFPQTHLIWHKVAPTLAEHFNLVIPDIRGYGGSSKPPAPSASDHSLYAKSTMASDISALMRALGHTQYNVCGHDRGARVTHALCVIAPTEVRRAMIMDIVPTLSVYEATDIVVATAYWHWFFLPQPAPFPEDSIGSAPGVFAAKMLRGLPRGRGRSAEEVFGKAAYEAYAAQFTDPDALHAMCEDYRAGMKEDVEEQKRDLGAAGRKIKCPVRLLWGAHGLVEKRFDCVAEWRKVCEEGCVDGKSEALDCGHYIVEELPDESLQHILEFFKE